MCGKIQNVPKECSHSVPGWIIQSVLYDVPNEVTVRADCLATNTEYCDRCTHAATQATNVARIKTEGTKGLLQGQVAG
jgi:hypothetical protein